jgi:hypothetical protein
MFDLSVSGGLSAELPTGHETATGQRAYLEAESQSVASEVEVKEVAALGLLAVSLREYLDERAVMRGCHASEFLQRCGRILVSIRICDPHPDESDQSSRLVKGSQTPKEFVLSLCQGREVNEKGPGRTLGQVGAGPAPSSRGIPAPFLSYLFFRKPTGRAGKFSRTFFRPAGVEEPAH